MKLEYNDNTEIFMLEENDMIVSGNGNRYLILDFISIGKNGAVFRAVCTGGVLKGTRCAVKVQYNLAHKRLVRFRREVAFLKNQANPYFVSYYDDGELCFSGKRYPFVVLSYFPYTLEEYVRANQVSLEKKVDFSCQLLMALDLLKKQGVIHRDIKPQNLLTDGSHIILADFGLVKSINDIRTDDDSDLINASATMPRYYRTPELVAFARGEVSEFYTESDVFQMGLVLSWLFTGVNPLRSSNSKLDEIVLHEVEIKEKAGETIHSIIAKMLEMNRLYRIEPTMALSGMLHVNGMISGKRSDHRSISCSGYLN